MAKTPRRPLTKPKPAPPQRVKKSRNRPAAGQEREKSAKKAVTKLGQARAAKKSIKAIKPWTAAEVREAFSRFRKANPEPEGELEHLNPYTLLVAVVLSAQATDAGVNKATRALFAVAATPQKMIALAEDKGRDYINTIGLYRHKAS